jgi:hypothetical protein
MSLESGLAGQIPVFFKYESQRWPQTQTCLRETAVIDSQIHPQRDHTPKTDKD